MAEGGTGETELWAGEEGVSDEVDISEWVDGLCKKHGGVRAASRALGIDAAFLVRIRKGEKHPSDKNLAKLGLKKRVIYVLQ